MANEKIVRWRVCLSGRVQGVGFRYFCREAAETRGLRGWVRNCPDGSVELEIQSDETSVAEFIQHLKTGHLGARVEQFRSWPIPPRTDDADSFDIRF